MGLENLLRQRSDLWRAGDLLHADGASTVPSGFAGLDRELAGGGWPRGELIELLAGTQGAGALRLVAPALARLSREEGWILWVDPPRVPYAPGLAEQGVELSRLLLLDTPDAGSALWALEQGLRSGVCSAVLGWRERLEWAMLRRLQLAAQAGQAMAWLFRSEQAAEEVSPAALRLQVRSCRGGGLETRVLKRRGGWATEYLRL